MTTLGEFRTAVFGLNRRLEEALAQAAGVDPDEEVVIKLSTRELQLALAVVEVYGGGGEDVEDVIETLLGALAGHQRI